VPIENDLTDLRNEICQMWKLVISQLEKAKLSFLNNDLDIARELISREKRVDAFELKIDSDSENYIALYNPRAIDLRLVLSLIKISNTLERIGDFAEGIARHVIKDECVKISPQVIEELQIEKMFDTVIAMLTGCFSALESESVKISGTILAMDEEVDSIYYSSIGILTNYLQANPDLIWCGLNILLLIRKLERTGDHCSNIVEDIVFYIDAKVLKHGRKSTKSKTKNSELG
jgi:phosphate transport system protein